MVYPQKSQINRKIAKHFARAVRRGQILLSTLLILLIIALTIVSLTITVQRNAQQVSSNADYSRSANATESRVITAVKNLNNVDLSKKLDVYSLTSAMPGAESCVVVGPNPTNNQFGDIFSCSFEELDGSRSVVKISKDNQVINYNLGREDYFDIILAGAQTSKLSFSWVGQKVAFDIALVIKDGNVFQESHVLVDTTTSGDIFSSGAITGGQNGAIMIEAAQKLKIDIASWPGGVDVSKAVYLRIKCIDKEAGSTISIIPEDLNNLPAQVLKLEALNYDLKLNSSATPGFITQLPLAPQVVQPLLFANNFSVFHSQVCGDGLKEGSEYCDLGDLNGGAACPKDCKCPYNLREFSYESSGTLGDGVRALGDGEIDISDVGDLCAGSDAGGLRFSSGGEFNVDDLLIMIKASDSITTEVTSDGYNFVLPKAYIIFAPSTGSLNGLTVKSLSTFDRNLYYQYTDGSNSIWPRNSEKMAQMLGDGWNIRDWHESVSNKELRDLGFVDSDNVVHFKFVAIGAGVGGSNVKMLAF